MSRYIDADALKEHLDYVCVGGGKWGDAEKAFINAFKDFVDGEITIQLELPSAERKGKWIETGYAGNDNYNFKCSCCGHSDTHSKAVEVPYCWYCGARMEGVKEE